MDSIPRALTIAGSDSGGGAGIQADLKTFTSLGVYGMSAVTAVTVQNTVGVYGIQVLDPEVVSAQIDAVLSDIGADAAKTGMLANEEIIEQVARALEKNEIENLVVDPVMIAKSGDVLLETRARRALTEKIIPLATVVTPNLHEAGALLETEISDLAGMREAARRLIDLGPKWVVVKGGHLTGEAADIAYNGSDFIELKSERLATKNTHGTGCTYSAAIAAYLARGLEVEQALYKAKEYITFAIRHSLNLGAGHGPVNHFYFKKGGPVHE